MNITLSRGHFMCALSQANGAEKAVTRKSSAALLFI